MLNFFFNQLFTANIWFDNAFCIEENLKVMNSYVKNFIDCVNESAVFVFYYEKWLIMIKSSFIFDSSFYGTEDHGMDKLPTTYRTPYGGRLEWTMNYGNRLIVHLKDKDKIRIKKRWSQVFYMYNIIDWGIFKSDDNDFNLSSQDLFKKHSEKLDRTYILALDGDVDFEVKPNNIIALTLK